MIEIENVSTAVVMLLIVLVPAFAVAAGVGAYRFACWLADRNPIRVEYAPGQRILRREKSGHGLNGPNISKFMGPPSGHCW